MNGHNRKEREVGRWEGRKKESEKKERWLDNKKGGNGGRRQKREGRKEAGCADEKKAITKPNSCCRRRTFSSPKVCLAHQSVLMPTLCAFYCILARFCFSRLHLLACWTVENTIPCSSRRLIRSVWAKASEGVSTPLGTLSFSSSKV